MNIISLEQGKTMAERLLEEALFRLDISNFVNSNAPCEIIGLTMNTILQISSSKVQESFSSSRSLSVNVIVLSCII